ncbi:MAG: hypothetical protein K5905_30605 [Roseibium sp.]|uniref:Ig-like domain-containing protein n=1 Tax=Roseibium sp. TaxID=1936156 RepID=UPI002628C5B1|nr:Ig-like domain-containing protein [Roseibium sp.]MCV0429812.1 hypothetical protein [Roseibium sp.]
MRFRPLMLSLFFLTATFVPGTSAMVVGANITASDITTANGSYKAGDTVAITTTYNESVTVTGVPSLALNFGGRVANYTSGTGSTTLTWTYTVQAGDTSASVNASAQNAIALDAGEYINSTASNNAADNTLPTSLLGPNSVVIDTTSPTVTVEQKSGQADPTSSGPILFTVTFSESVTGFTAGDVTIGGTSAGGSASVTGSGASYEINVTGMTSDGTVNATIGAGLASDAAGNTNAASTSTDNQVTYTATSSSSGSSSGSGTPSPGSHGFYNGAEGQVSNKDSTEHSLDYSGTRGVKTIQVILVDEGAVGFQTTTRDQTPEDLPAGYTGTTFWVDIVQTKGGTIESAMVTLGPFAGGQFSDDPQALAVLHGVNGGWVSLPTEITQFADGTFTVTFTTQGFSPFVMAIAPSTPGESSAPENGAIPEDPEPDRPVVDAPTPGFAVMLIALFGALLIASRHRR